jgi:predicted RND superfamily exporter protein
MSHGDSHARRLTRRYWLTLIAVVATLPVLAIGAQHSIDGMCIAPEQWAPESHTQRQQYDQFTQQFEGNDVAVVSWDGCTVDDRRLLDFERELNTPTRPERQTHFAQAFDRVITGYSAVRELQAPPLNLTRDEAAQRLRGTLIGPDGQTSCAVVVLTFDGNADRTRSIETIIAVAEEKTGLSRDELHIAGPPVDGVTIDAESRQGVNVFGALSTLASVALCWFCIRSWMLTGTIILAGLTGQAFVLALVHFLGFRLDAILIVMPSLVFVLTVSAGIHLIGYHTDDTPTGHNEHPAVRALRLGWKPCLLAALTTAIGLSSLVLSEIRPVAAFGGIAAIGLMASVSLLLLLLPGAMVKWPPRVRAGSQQTSTRWGEFSSRVCRSSGMISVVGIIALVALTGGLSSIATSVDVLSLFAPESRSIRDYTWLETNIGPVIPVEVAVEIDPACELSLLERMRLIDQLGKRVGAVEGLSGVTSAVTFAPPLETGTDLASMFRARVLDTRLQQDRQRFVDEHYLYENDEQQIWRISARASALAGVRYTDIMQQLRKSVEDELSENSLASELPAGQVRARFTGIMPLIETVQEMILQDLSRSFGTAFLLITLVMIAVVRSLRTALVAMVPNVFPVVAAFGLMGWLAVPVDIGSLMTASVALGIAVDDTIHFLASYRRLTAQGNDSESAVRGAIHHCGRAMLQTTVICGLGLLVFAASSFIPTHRFGLMMCGLMVAALAGDLLLLPALLVVVGKRFSKPPEAGSHVLPSVPTSVEV